MGAELLLAAAFGAEGHSRDGPQPGGRVRRDSHPAVLLAPVPLSLCAEDKEGLRGELDQGEGAEPWCRDRGAFPRQQGGPAVPCPGPAFSACLLPQPGADH